MHEFRARLIADVVTGKLDVSAAAPQLPDGGGEPLNVNLEDVDETIEEAALVEDANG